MSRISPDIADFVQKQKAAVIDAFKNDMELCLVATTWSKIGDHAKTYQWAVSELDGTRARNAIVIRKQSSDFPELWVKVAYRGYQRAFIKYLRKWHNVLVSCIPSAWQVDHLLCRHRYKVHDGDYYIRLALVERSINASYGAGFEKIFYGRERERVLEGGVHMDYVTLLKILSIRFVSISEGLPELKAWAHDMACKIEGLGIEPKELAYLGLTVNMNLGFFDRYKPFSPCVQTDRGFDGLFIGAE